MTQITLPPARLTPRDAIAVIFKRKWAMCFFYVALVGTVGAYCFFWPPTYEASVRFLIKNDRQEPIISTDQESVRMLARQIVTEEDLHSEMAIVTSATVLEQTARDVNLDSMPEHWAVRLLSAPFNFASEVYNDYHGKPTLDAFGKAVGRLARKVAVVPEKRSSILSVKVRWGDPRFAEHLLRKLSDNYMAQHLAIHKSADTQDFFQQRVEETKRELTRIEKQIEGVRPGATTGMINIEKDLYLKQALDFESEARRTGALLAEARAKVESGEEQLSLLPQRILTEEKILSNPLALGTLKSRVLELQLRRVQLLQKYTPEQPLVKQAEEELQQAQDMLTSELGGNATERTTNINQVEQAVRQDTTLGRTKLRSLEALRTVITHAYGEYQNRLNQIQKNGFVLQQLERERHATEQSLLAYQKKYEEARANDQLNRMRLVNVAPVEPVRSSPDPVKPARWLLMKLAFSIGLVLAIGFGFLLELMDQRVRSERDIELELGVTVMATLDRYSRDLFANGSGAPVSRR